MEFLVCECKANVHAEFQDDSGISASLIHIAVEQGHENMIQLLEADYNLDINQLDCHKWTLIRSLKTQFLEDPFHYAKYPFTGMHPAQR